MRKKDTEWNCGDDTSSIEQAQLAVLMDLRDELKRLNSLLHCPNFVEIPGILRGIRTKLPVRKKRKSS